METLPPENLNEILLKTEKYALFNAAQVSHLWRDLAFRQIVSLHDEKAWREAGILGDKLSMTHASPRMLTEGLAGACEGEHSELAQWLMEKGAKCLNGCLHEIRRKNNRELAELLIAGGAHDLNGALFSACENNHQELAAWLIQEGATNLQGGLWEAQPQDSERAS